MGILSGMKAAKAVRLQKAGNRTEAIRLYEEAFAEGVNDPRYLLPYALMIIRDGQYQKAREFLVKHQKAPGMSPQQRTELLVYYATCCLRLGNVEKGISTLEAQFRKAETGLIYQTLGYMYVEKYDLANKPDFAAMAAEAAAAGETEETAGESAEVSDGTAGDAAGENAGAADTGDAAGESAADAGAGDSAGENAGESGGASDETGAVKKTPEEEWNEGADKAEEFIRKSIEYDDEDAICLDNLGEFLYRARGDKAGAKEWFDKAIELKPGQIDTLYFLSRYDLEKGDKKAALEKLEKAAAGRFSPLNYTSPEMIAREIEEVKEAL